MLGEIQINITTGFLRLASVFPHLRVIASSYLDFVAQFEGSLTVFELKTGSQAKVQSRGARTDFFKTPRFSCRSHCALGTRCLLAPARSDSQATGRPVRVLHFELELAQCFARSLAAVWQGLLASRWG
jgi:hypothetical protein